MHNERAYSCPVGEPLSDGELIRPLFLDRPACQKPALNPGTLYSINSTYLEVIDQSHAERHFVILAFCLGLIGLGGMLMMLYFSIFWLIGEISGSLPAQNRGDEYITYIAPFLFLGLTYIFYRMERWALLVGAFYYKRLPIRFNRQTQTIYACRGNKPGDVWEIPWSANSRWYFCLAGVHAPKNNIWWKGGALAGSIDIRAYELDDNQLIVRSFGIGPGFYSETEARSYWEYYRRYMNDGPQSLRIPHFFWPQKEGLVDMFLAALPFRETLFGLVCIPMGLVGGLCRWFSLVTSKEIVWPAEVEVACAIPQDDPWQRPPADHRARLSEEFERPLDDLGWRSSAERFTPEKAEAWSALYQPFESPSTPVKPPREKKLRVKKRR